MSWPLALTVRHWAAWAPGLETASQWHDWATGTLVMPRGPDSPPVDFVPALLRRRLSRLSRLALVAARDCTDEKLPTVFASRHGEIHRTAGLLDALARQEPLSPMAFSLSVHNTASGLYAIHTGNTAPSTAVAAGRDTLAMALVEAAGQLLRHDEVLLVYAEEPLPASYAPLLPELDTIPLGLALRLSRSGIGQQAVLSPCTQGTPPPATSNGFALLRWLAGSADSCLLDGEYHRWRWESA